MNPVNLPDPQDAPPPYGLVRTILFFVLYAGLIAGAVLYLRWKLPRHGGTAGTRRGEHDGLSDGPD